MKTNIMKSLVRALRFLPALAVAVALGAFTSINPASAAVEDIDWRIFLNEPIVEFFPNEVHPDYPKLLTFEGTAENPTATDGALVMFFDWVDINDPTITYTSDPVTIPLGDGDLLSLTLSESIPFCPPQVTLHARAVDAQLIEVVGTFTHECQVPEPSTTLTAGLGLLGLGLMTGRRRR
jgi:MYXO-CTERM domain-containing protein